MPRSACDVAQASSPAGSGTGGPACEKPRSRTRSLPRPFLKWAGGKRQILDELMARVRQAGAFDRYHEPFIGGGALFFEMVRSGRLGRSRAFLSDNNPNLIDAYQAVKEQVEDVIVKLRDHACKHSEDHYYGVRASVPVDLVDRAARVIYLNKTCFNGLYRENRKGQFNTPFGWYKNPTICNEEALRAAAEALKHAAIENRHFDTVTSNTKQGDFVYLDPPYHPMSKTASFTSYDKGRFGEDEQRRLAEVFRELTRRGVKALLSNSYTDFILDLYKDFTIEEVFASRAVNSRGDRRGKVSEALIRNF